MFNIKFDRTQFERKTIGASDLLPKYVENTNGFVNSFDADKIFKSIVSETEMDKKDAKLVTVDILRILASYDLEKIAAPHIREIGCFVMSGMNLHEYRNKYTRLGMPLMDVKKMLKDDSSTRFKYLWLQSQVIEEFIHLSGYDDVAKEFVHAILKSADKLNETERELIRDSLANSILLYCEKENNTESDHINGSS